MKQKKIRDIGKTRVKFFHFPPCLFIIPALFVLNVEGKMSEGNHRMNFSRLLLGTVLLFGSTLGRSLAQGTPATTEILEANQAYVAGNYSAAAGHYEKTIQLDPQSAPAYQGLGNSYYQLGQKAAALAAYEQSLKLNPGNLKVASAIASLKKQIEKSAAMAAAQAPSFKIVETTAAPLRPRRRRPPRRQRFPCPRHRRFQPPLPSRPCGS